MVSHNLSIKETVHESKNNKTINLLTVADEGIVIFLTQIERLIMFSTLVSNTLLAKSLLPTFKQTASIAILVAGIGLFGIKSANGRDVLAQTPNTSQSSSYAIAQLVDANSPLYGSWSLRYSVDGVVYQSVLVMKGYSGMMRTRYFDSRINRSEVVDQEINLKSSPQGLVLLGYNPVYPGTSRRHPTYAADNFLFSVEPDGSVIAYTCDDLRRCSAVDVESIVSQS
ncbi:hypothetical protein [Nostoc sp. 'Peltigera membranacea cyanobiont' N6]|uniref:hypothetical protein n=1 Tax=Nostoc sp. 'Peltigera membranacea cyanobiont' N6 TaxID=1261031 RepID=UPI0021584F15|nr:hypothetical protein [Nostoc sp. 'Peltigera membranacea cyanobiont' N6]